MLHLCFIKCRLPRSYLSVPQPNAVILLGEIRPESSRTTTHHDSIFFSSISYFLLQSVSSYNKQKVGLYRVFHDFRA
jgi:hypothetical protein